MLTITYIQAMLLHTQHTQGRFNNYTVCSLYSIGIMASSVEGVIQKRNIVPKARIKPTYLAFWASVLTITPPRLVDVTTLPMSTCVCAPMLLSFQHYSPGSISSES